MDVHTILRTKLKEALDATHLSVENESHRHNVPPGSQSHFRVTVVSQAFEAEGLVARHRRVHRVLEAELAGPVHALALHTYTPDEWAQREDAPASPPCLGGGQAAD